MRKLKQSTLVTAIVSAGLLSAVICQCNMQMALAASSSHHCDPEEENVPVEPCCRVMLAAELRVVKAIVVIPEAVRADPVDDACVQDDDRREASVAPGLGKRQDSDEAVSLA